MRNIVLPFDTSVIDSAGDRHRCIVDNILYIPEFRRFGTEKFPSCRQVVKDIAYLDIGAPVTACVGDVFEDTAV